MNTVTLQVPMSKTLRQQAQIVADEYGFSSIQEVIRLFLNRFSQKSISLNWGDRPIQLSQRAAIRYDKMIDEIESGKTVPTIAHNATELFNQLGV